MRKCPKCNSLVGDDVTEHCGVPLDEPKSGISATATVALSPEQIASLTGETRPTPPPRRPPAEAGSRGRRPPTGSRPARPAGTGFAAVATHNKAADRALQLGVLAILPLFPIALAAFVYGILGLSFAAHTPAAPGRGKAWFGVVSGALFGIVWTAVTASLLLG